MTTFITSDLHFGHANIIDYCDRPFKDVDHMTEALIANWNSVVGPDDSTWILGDLVMGDREKNLEHVKRLNGHKMLLPGNHDHCHPMYKAKADKWKPIYEAAGLLIAEVEQRLVLSGVRLCHFPYDGDSTDEQRYGEWRPADDGGLLLHGHIHDLWKINGRQLNVGCDVWDYTPIPLDFAVNALLEAQA